MGEIKLEGATGIEGSAAPATLAYWMGQPLSALSREDLENRFIYTYRQLENAREQIRDLNVEHIRDLAEMARRGQKAIAEMVIPRLPRLAQEPPRLEPTRPWWRLW